MESVRANTVRALLQEFDRGLAELSARKTEEIRGLRRQLSRKLTDVDGAEIMQLARQLLQRGDFVYRFVAYELIASHKGASQGLRAQDLEQLGDGIASWEAVDTFACYLAGPAWRQRQVADRVVHGWARSTDRWWRRAALVSTVPLNNKARGGSGDCDRTLAVCTMLVADRDDMVVKAMSWALRELAKRDSAAVQEFLLKYGGRLAPRVLREVRNKLSTGLKNPRIRSSGHRLPSQETRRTRS